jgi:hypothetical protein
MTDQETSVLSEPRAWVWKEMAGAAVRMLRPTGNPWGVTTPRSLGAGAVLSHDPLVIFTAIGLEVPLGMGNGLRRQLAGTPATFLLGVHGSLERWHKANRVRRAAILHRALHPEHRFIVMCNTPEEQRKLTGLGEIAVFLNHNMLAGTDIFLPIPGTPQIYDAVCVARLDPQKRHHLALKVDTCAMVFHRSSTGSQAFENEVIARHTAEAPGHVFINQIGPNGPVALAPSEVNHICNQAHVGLCLSEVEGAMYASIEYLLAGLPVVSTENFGGRDIYFDPDYCLITPPDPDLVRRAVLELKARRIPRGYVRARTLAKIEADRSRFLDFLEGLSVALPADARTRWPFPPKVISWKPWRDFLPEIFPGS